MTAKFAVGRHISGEAFDLTDCEIFDTVSGAVGDLKERISMQDPGNSGHLDLLQCMVDDEGNTQHYWRVSAGTLFEYLLHEGLLNL